MTKLNSFINLLKRIVVCCKNLNSSQYIFDFPFSYLEFFIKKLFRNYKITLLPCCVNRILPGVKWGPIRQTILCFDGKCSRTSGMFVTSISERCYQYLPDYLAVLLQRKCSCKSGVFLTCILEMLSVFARLSGRPFAAWDVVHSICLTLEAKPIEWAAVCLEDLQIKGLVQFEWVPGFKIKRPIHCCYQHVRGDTGLVTIVMILILSIMMSARKAP